MSKTNIPYVIKTNGSVTLYLGGECMTVAQDHPNYSAIIVALKSGDHSKIDNLINIAKAVVKYSSNKIEVKNGQIFYGDYLVHNTLTNRILSMMREGFKFDHMIKFLENLMQNPSARAVNETYTFLENYGLPITDDGCFLAYKAVSKDYKDIYTGKLDNRIGATPTMPRNQVDENYVADCSTGLHVGALDYVVQYGHFTKGVAPTVGGNHLMIVKVNPRDVVSVPKYENHPKMRVCTYTVISEITDVVKELDKVVYKSDATVLTPDVVVNTTVAETAVLSYDEGFDAGDDDLEDGSKYGTSRDYSQSGDYLAGYNDAYNGRDYDPPFDSSDDDGDDDSDEGNVSEYDDGFDTGECDRTNGFKYGCTRDYDQSGDYLKGYNDAYNNRPYNNPDDTLDGLEVGSNGNVCDCGQCNCDSSDYGTGFAVGYADAVEGAGFEASLDVDDTDDTKKGYHEGFQYARDMHTT